MPSCRTAQLVGRRAAKGAAGSMTSLGVWDQLELGRKASGASGKCIRHGWPAIDDEYNSGLPIPRRRSKQNTDHAHSPASQMLSNS